MSKSKIRLERIKYENLFPTHDKVFVDCDKLNNLLRIASWRNEVLPCLRSPLPTPISIEHQLGWVKSFDVGTDHYFFIYSTERVYYCRCMGYCGLNKVDKINGTAEMSLLIDPYFRGKGLGREAVKKLLKYGFNKLKLQCIYIECYTSTNNWMYWKKMGFKEEGRLRKRKLVEGIYYDSIIASILKEEWEERNGK